MKVLVTGAGGYIGIPVVKRLAGRGDSVIGFGLIISPDRNIPVPAMRNHP